MKQLVRFLRMKFIGRVIFLRSRYYKLIFKEFGEEARVLGRIRVISPEKIVLGKNVAINEGCFLNARGGITIGDNVNISPGVYINTGGLDYTKKGAARLHHWNGVTIKTGAWIGSGALINPGVTIGENSVIGAGSVVTKDVPNNVVAVGVPARVLKEIAFDS